MQKKVSKFAHKSVSDCNTNTRKKLQAKMECWCKACSRRYLNLHTKVLVIATQERNCNISQLYINFLGGKNDLFSQFGKKHGC
jgi:hypothetical protein